MAPTGVSPLVAGSVATLGLAGAGEVACFVIEPGAEEAVSSAGAPEGTASGASSRLSNITTVKRATHVATKTNIRFLIMAGESG